MCKIVRVRLGFCLNRYGSIEEAVVAGRSSEKQEKIKGQTLLNYQFDGSKLVCAFQNGLNLIISCGDKRVDWEVTPDAHILDTSAHEHTMFELPSGTRFRWNWKEVLDSFVGKKLSILPSEQMLFLYVHSSKEYVVNVYTKVSAPESRFLHISEV